MHYEDGLVQCSNVDGKKAREGRGERAGAGENVPSENLEYDFR